jgi:ketosteroid isomerase-like protein
VGDTLGARLAERDAAAFVGRQAELTLLERHLARDSPTSVVYVHGPGGIGKSTLLRELARRAEVRGYVLRWVEGRDVPPVPDALEDALAGVRELTRPLVVLDSFERIAGAGGYLRRAILPTLPEHCLVVIASRQPPDESWFQGGWEKLLTELELGPLSDDDARALARAGGVSAQRAPELVAWARGSPLALTLASDVCARDRTFRPGCGMDEHAGLVDAVIRRLAGTEIEGPHWSTLAVAAIARSVTVPMLGEVLPDRAASEEYEWLRRRTFVEQVGEGLALHHLAGEALRADLRHRDPERERELRRRIADHLHERARGGEVLMAIDLAHLIESKAIRWGYSWEASASYHLDDPRPGDVDAFEAALRGTRHAALWRESREFFERTPEHVGVVRNRDGDPLGYTVALTPATAPPSAASDPVLGPRLDHARGLGEPDATVVFRDMVDLSRDRSLQVIGMLGMAGMLRAAHANPRYAYLIIDPALGGASEFATALGARHVPALDAEVGGVRLECHLLDHGLGGMVAHEREVVYRELGLPAPERRPATDDVSEAVRDALRNLDRPGVLARSELASGETIEERAASVRALLAAIAERAFGEGPSEELLRQVLIRGYLDPASSHDLIAEQLSLTRPAYFRRLRAVSERLSTYISSTALQGVGGWLRSGLTRARAESVVRQACDALSARDLNRLIALTDERVEIATTTGPLAGTRPHYHGHEGLARYVDDLSATFTKVELQPQRFNVIDDERILVFGRVRAWDPRGFVDIASAWAFAIRDGKVVSIQVFGNPGEAHGAFRD